MADAATEKPTSGPRPTAADPFDLSALQRAVVLTVIYSDLFDFPLTEDELHRFLVLTPTDRDGLRKAVSTLLGGLLEKEGDLIFLAGRRELVRTRQRRSALAEQRWAAAARYGRWLVRVPFVRLVAVCGSQAAHNPGENSDLDFFCVTASNRLWLVQICAMALRRIAGLFSIRVCPNYFLTLDSLEVGKKDLYQAREACQAVPLHGSRVYDEFVDANGWIAELLPNLTLGDQRRYLSDLAPPTLTRWCERLLGGRVGSFLDAVVYRMLLFYYPLRLRHLGWRKKDFRRAYRRDRQLVMTGGYGGEVQRQFLASVARHLGADAVAGDLERLFPGSPDGAETGSDPVYSRLFHQRYGGPHG